MVDLVSNLEIYTSKFKWESISMHGYFYTYISIYKWIPLPKFYLPDQRNICNIGLLVLTVLECSSEMIEKQSRFLMLTCFCLCLTRLSQQSVSKFYFLCLWNHVFFLEMEVTLILIWWACNNQKLWMRIEGQSIGGRKCYISLLSLVGSVFILNF